MKRRLFLDVVIGKSPSIFELFSGENQTLLIRRDSFLVLDLSLNIVDRIARFNLERDRLRRQCLHEDLHFLCRRLILNYTHEPETVTALFTEALDTLPEPVLREWWLTISTEPFGRDKTRATTIRDPLIRFMHYLIATSICPRTRSREWVTRQDLFFLYCLCTGTRCNLARGLAAHFASCRHMQERSLIYGGCYITHIATVLGVLTYRLHLTPIQGKAIGRQMLFPMGLVRDFGPPLGLRWAIEGVLFEPPAAAFFGPHPEAEDYIQPGPAAEAQPPPGDQEQPAPAHEAPAFDEQHPRHVYRVAQLPARVEELLQQLVGAVGDQGRQLRDLGRQLRDQGRRIDRVEDIAEWRVDLELAREHGLPFPQPPPRRQYPPDSP